MLKTKIFNTSEKNTFESPPVFNNIERKQFFALSGSFNQLMNGLKSPTNKTCFLVTAGYFKARYRFFSRQFHQTDIEFVAKQLGLKMHEVQLSSYNRATYRRHQDLILHHFGFSPFDSAAALFATSETARIVRVQFRLKLILLEIIAFLTRKKIALPSYNVLATLVVTAVNQHQSELSTIIQSNLTKEQKEILDALLEQVTGAGSSDKWRYQITLLKKPSQSSRPAKIKVNTTDFNDLLTLYLAVKPVLTRLALSRECLRYYAYSVLKSQVHQVSRRSEEVRYLHLIAFIANQTLKLQDMLIDTLLLAVQAVKNATDKAHKDLYYQERESRNQSVTHWVEGLQKGFAATIAIIQTIIVDVQLTADQKISAIDTTLNTPEAKEATTQQSLTNLQSNMAKLQQGPNYYTQLEEHSLKLQNRVADIVRYAIFDPNCSNPLLLEAVLHYQKKCGTIDKQAPLAFLSAEQRALIINPEGKFRVSLYKALLYCAIADAIKSGVLNLVHSAKYRSLEDYLIPKEEWDARKDEILQQAELSEYSDCLATLKILDEGLSARYLKTNQHFTAGKNAFLTFRLNGTFHVSTPKLEEVDVLSLGGVFPQKKYIPLLEALATVDRATGFLEEFEHWQKKHPHLKTGKKDFPRRHYGLWL